MKVNAFFGIIAIALILISSQTFAQQGIAVTGKATISKAPDQFLLRLWVNERGINASKTKQRVDLKSKQVLAALTSFGIHNEALTSTQLQITPIFKNTKDNIEKIYVTQSVGGEPAVVSLNQTDQHKNEHTVNVEFDVSRQIEVKLNDIAQYEEILDKVTRLGINRISPVQSSIANAERIYQEALELAVVNAKNKAEKLAKQLGVTLVNVISLEEYSHQAPGKMHMFSEASVRGGGFQSHAGLDEVSAEVRITFDISAQ